MSLTFGSVCSGIEAASMAWGPLGWRASFFAEVAAFPCAVLRHHHPEVPCHGDFTTIAPGDYAAIDLLVGGTPCQSFSVAGLRGGLDDDRGNLALEFLRLADRLRPRWLVWENVPGVLSSNDGRDFGAILGGMVELGYGLAYRVLDAQFFGVAQRRRRVFVVGHLGDWRRAAAVLFERQGLSGDPAPRRQARQGVARTLAGGARQRGGCSSDDIPLAFGGNDRRGAIDVATAVTARGGPHGRLDFDSETFVAHSLRAEGFDASEDGTGRGTPLVPVCFDPRQADVLVHGDMTGPLDTGFPGPAIAFSSKDYGGDAESDLSPTLRAGGHDGLHANAGCPPAIAFALRGREDGAVPEMHGGGDSIGALRAASGGASRDFVAFAENSRAEVRLEGGDGAICAALKAGGGKPGQSYPAIAAFTCSDQANGFAWERDFAPTLNAQVPNDSSNIQQGVRIGAAVRRLTPRECERLQGFPDDYTLIPWRGGMAPDGPRYKALGNSMAVPVMAWIGRRIAMVDAMEVAT